MPEARSADNHCTILIAEDDEALRESLTALLRSDEHEILQAGDGEDALRVLQGGAVDVLVLDLHMPKLDGAELLGRIDVPPPQVIIYSAFEYFEIDEIERRFGNKISSALRKPVPPRTLISVVEHACSVGH